jgi:HNH endonuclease
MRGTPSERFWAKVTAHASGCWLWGGHVSRKGYGQFKVAGRHVPAHRWAYELFYGAVPRGLQIDHVRARGCHHRHCVNPAHLEAVTGAENTARGRTGAHWAAKTHCPAGHAYTGANLHVNTRGARCCRACNAARTAVYRARKKAA